jgi:excisionase family DNA binding protein
MAQSHLDAHYLKVSQVADLLQLTESAVYQLCQQGELPAVKVTEKSIRIPAKALETYLRRLNKDTQGEMYIMNPVEYTKR